MNAFRADSDGSTRARSGGFEHERGLVLGGGGVAGIAWTTGLLLGMEEAGGGLDRFDCIVGTSAGATVGAQVTSGMPLADLFRRQVDPAHQVEELKPDPDTLRLAVGFGAAFLFARGDAEKLRRKAGRVAAKARTVDPERRRRVIEARLPDHEWPDRRMGIVAADAESGELRVFDRESGVPLVDAVAASCAVPGVWPLVRIQGRDYFDGGVPSPDNARLAADCAEVLVVSPMGRKRSGRMRRHLAEDVESLEKNDVRVVVVSPDEASREAMGRNALDPESREGAARAGREQGRAAEVE